MTDDTKKQIQDLQTQDLALMQKQRRQAFAKQAGLPLEEDPVILGSEISVTHNHPPQPASVLKSVATTLLGLTTAAGLVGAGAWLALKNSSTMQPPPAAAPPTTAAAVKPPEPVELRVKWWVEDGQVKTEVQKP